MSSLAAKKRRTLMVRKKTKRRHEAMGMGSEGSASRMRREALYASQGRIGLQKYCSTLSAEAEAAAGTGMVFADFQQRRPQHISKRARIAARGGKSMIRGDAHRPLARLRALRASASDILSKGTDLLPMPDGRPKDFISGKQYLRENQLHKSVPVTHQFLRVPCPTQRHGAFIHFVRALRRRETRSKSKLIVFVATNKTALQLSRELGVKTTSRKLACGSKITKGGRKVTKVVREIKGVRTMTLFTKEHDAKAYVEDFAKGKVHTIFATDDSPDLKLLLEIAASVPLCISYDMPKTIDGYRRREAFTRFQERRDEGETISTKKKFVKKQAARYITFCAAQGSLAQQEMYTKIQSWLKTVLHLQAEVKDLCSACCGGNTQHCTCDVTADADGGGCADGDAKANDYAAKVRSIYARANPAKLETPGFIEGLMKKVKGKEEKLIKKLETLYPQE